MNAAKISISVAFLKIPNFDKTRQKKYGSAFIIEKISIS